MKSRTLLISTLLGVFTLAVVVSCTSGRKQLAHGNYQTALYQALNRLQNSPNNHKAQETLIQAYPLAVKFYRRQIDQKLTSADPHRWEWLVAHYEAVNLMYEAIQKSPVALSKIANPIHYYDQLPEARRQAAEARYEWGLQALAAGSKVQARQAFEHFQIAEKMHPGYKVVDQMLARAWEQGTVKVMVDLVPISSRYYQVSAAAFQQEVYDFLATYETSRFVDFVLLEEAPKYTKWDQILKVQFEDFVVGQTHTFHKQKKMHRDSVVVGSVILKDGSKRPVFNTVKATVNLFKKEVQSRGLVSLKLIEAQTGAVIHHDELPGEYLWFTEWGHFNGDERALNKRQQKLCDNREALPPSAQAMFIEFTKPIHQQFTERIGYLYQEL